MKSPASPERENFVDKITACVENVILASRYLLVPLYCALVFLIVRILVDFFKVLTKTAQAPQLIEHTLEALELLDITMVANLIWFIGAGSYFVFVRPYPNKSSKNVPRSLAHISTGILKEKMAGSLIGVSSVNLLQIFTNAAVSQEPVDIARIAVLIAIHLVFIIGLLAFNYANRAEHHNHPEEKEKSATA